MTHAMFSTSPSGLPISTDRLSARCLQYRSAGDPPPAPGWTRGAGTLRSSCSPFLVAVGAPPLARLLVAIPAAMAASGYLQAWLKFCAGFGSRGIFNFGEIGETHEVIDAEAHARDRSRSRQIGLASLAIGVAVGIVATLLPW